jgi:hypothetical protein
MDEWTRVCLARMHSAKARVRKRLVVLAVVHSPSGPDY